jgi:hypothetical protein
MDVVHDQLADGRSFRLFNASDDFNCEGQASRWTFRCHPGA